LPFFFRVEGASVLESRAEPAPAEVADARDTRGRDALAAGLRDSDRTRADRNSGHAPQVDPKGNLGCVCWSGCSDIRAAGRWLGAKMLPPADARRMIGFMEPAGADGGAYVTWEEADHGDPDKGLGPDSIIFVGRLLPGSVTEL
jgi:hypothetical protein